MPERETWDWACLKATAARKCAWCSLPIDAGALMWLGSRRRPGSRASRHLFVCLDCERRRWNLEHEQ